MLCLQLASKLILWRNRAKSSWSRPEAEKARRRAEARREPFSPITQIHGLCSRLQLNAVLKPVVGITATIVHNRCLGCNSFGRSISRYDSRLCRKTRSGFERPFFRLAASGCIDDTSNTACFAVFARRKNCSLSGRRWSSPTDSQPVGPSLLPRQVKQEKA
jgi:hypothetical protein